MKKRNNIVILGILLTAVTFIYLNRQNQSEYVKNSGMVFGTFYHFTYEHPKGKDLHAELEKVLQDFDNSLSTYNDSSTISKINANISTTTDSLFNAMFKSAVKVSETTKGAFDISVAPLVNLWGFGFSGDTHASISQSTIDSISQFIGIDKVQLSNNTVLKADNRVQLDASAIAKGYSVDIVSEYLEEHNIKNYMVEIGGELRTKGLNPKGKKWIIGIDTPIDDPAAFNRALIERIGISGESMATSGNYRNFYIKDGKKYSHTINPKTGYPVDHNLLSATVLANDCMTADAYATAFMVMGVDKSLELAKNIPGLSLFLIYNDENGSMQTISTGNFSKYIVEE